MRLNQWGRRTFCAGCLVLGLSGMSRAAEPKLTFYLPFEDSMDARVADGNPKGKWESTQDPAQYVEGIIGKGWLSGKLHQAIAYDAKGNISPNQWTITFWVKGLEGADWHTRRLHEDTSQEFWQLFGDSGQSTRFYKYTDKTSIWLLNIPQKGKGKSQWIFAPKTPERQWHYWAVTWRKSAGACLYLDGRLVGQDASFPVVDPVKRIVIGQQFGIDRQDKIIDEFKIYDSAMDAGAIARQYYMEGNFATRPVLSVAPTQRKITIDGKIDPAEWQGAAGFSGLIDPKTWNMEAPATWGRMAYDEDNLYVAFHSDLPAEVKNSPDTTVQHGFLKNDATQHDELVSADDCFYLKAIPPDGGRYFFYANGINTTYDYSLPKEGGVDLAWEAHAQVKSIVDEQGWSMEIAIPLKAFHLERLSDGDVWRMDMGRVWKMLRQRTDRWAAGERTDDQPISPGAGMGTVRFVGGTQPTVDLKSFTISPDGRAQAVMDFRNGDSKGQVLKAALQADGKVLQEKNLSLEAGQQGQTTLEIPVTGEAGKLIAVTVKRGDTVLLRQAAPFVPRQVGQLAMWKYPSRGELRIGWVIQSASNPSTLDLEADLRDALGETVARKSVAHLPAARGSTLMDVKSLPDGKYKLSVRVMDTGGVVQQQLFEYEKKPLPKWLGNTLGIGDTPPPPWTNLSLAKPDDAVSIWGRTYEYGGRLLPRQIVNQKRPMLADPMRLVVDVKGEKPQSTSSGKSDSVQWTRATAMRADSERHQTLGPVRLQADSYVEFDGMTWMDLTVSPAGKAADLEGLILEIPLKSEWGELINPYDYSLRQTGALPADGWHGSARPLWVGNGNGGIQFFQETTATWIGGHGMDVVRNEKGQVVIRVHLIDRLFTLDKPRRFAFGWIVSPVKAAPKHHRDWRVMSGLSELRRGVGKRGGVYLRHAAAINPGLRPFSMWWQGWWWMPAGYKGNPDTTGTLPVPSGNKMCNAVLDTAFGLKILGAPYGRLSEIGTHNPWFSQFGDEWLADVNQIYRPDAAIPDARQKTTVSQAAPSLRDFFAWGYNQLLSTGNVQALYFDVSRPVFDNNIYHGAGTERADGPPSAQYTILATRKTFQRIYTMMKAKHPEGRIFYHMSGQVLLPIDSFTDGLIDGENYTGMLNRKNNRGYENVLTLDQFRAEYSAQNNFGPVSVFLPEFGRSGAIKLDEWKTLGAAHAEYLMGLMLLHDSTIWWASMPPDMVLAPLYLNLDKAGWDSSWTFIPYWNQKAFELPENVVASLYISPDQSKAVVVVMNLSDGERSVDLPLSSDLFKGHGFSVVAPIYPDRPAILQNGAVRNLRIERKNFRAILLK